MGKERGGSSDAVVRTLWLKKFGFFEIYGVPSRMGVGMGTVACPMDFYT